ncbi:hypothetical protein FACS1894170_00430 [Planctomycetales bacterium]|nr:hypothetical protein FACS1894170_00430 [Planctomycetales bacterium]
MSFFESLAKILAALFGTKKTSLDDVSVQDIERERNTLENTLRKKEQESKAKEQDKQQLFEDYKAAAAAKNEAAKRTIAQKLQRAELSLKALNVSITQIGKRIQTMDSLILMKETEPEKGIIDKIDVGDIQDKTIERQISAQEERDKHEAINAGIDGMLNAAGEPDYIMDDYMAQLDAQIADAPPVVETASGDLDRLEAIIEKGQATSQKLKESENKQ